MTVRGTVSAVTWITHHTVAIIRFEGDSRNRLSVYLNPENLADSIAAFGPGCPVNLIRRPLVATGVVKLFHDGNAPKGLPGYYELIPDSPAALQIIRTGGNGHYLLSNIVTSADFPLPLPL